MRARIGGDKNNGWRWGASSQLRIEESTDREAELFGKRFWPQVAAECVRDGLMADRADRVKVESGESCVLRKAPWQSGNLHGGGGQGR